MSADRDASGRSSDLTLVEGNVPDGRARLGPLGKLEDDSAAPRLAPSSDRSGDADEGVGIDVYDAAQVQSDGENGGA